MRRRILQALFLTGVLLVVIAGLRSYLAQGVLIVGDLAGDLTAATNAVAPAIPSYTGQRRTALQVIAVTDWEKLPLVAGAAEICGPDCFPLSEWTGVYLTRITVLGVDRFLFLNIAPFLDPAVADKFAFDADGLRCAGAIVAAEYHRDPPPACAANLSLVSRTRMAFP